MADESENIPNVFQGFDDSGMDFQFEDNVNKLCGLFYRHSSSTSSGSGSSSSGTVELDPNVSKWIEGIYNILKGSKLNDLVQQIYDKLKDGVQQDNTELKELLQSIYEKLNSGVCNYDKEQHETLQTLLQQIYEKLEEGIGTTTPVDDGLYIDDLVHADEDGNGGKTTEIDDLTK